MEDNLTRAQFLRKMFGFAVDHVTNAVEKRVEALTPDKPRPPWAISETEFLGTCEKCRSCGEICPRGVVSYHGADGYLAAETPYLDFQDDYCDYCGECVKVCPSGALSLEDGVEQIGRAKISKEACAAYSGTICRYCVDSCPESAITLESFMYPILDQDKCNGCGACIPRCIGDAIDIKKL